MFCQQVCRRIDKFVSNLYTTCAPNKNVEMNGRDSFKLFQHGVTHFVRNGRRIDGGWHISIARHFQIFLVTTDMIGSSLKKQFAAAYDLLFDVHASLRLPLRSSHVNRYQTRISDLVAVMVKLCAPYVKSKCNSIKYHWPHHWADTRLQLGCSAAEKSLERKLGEIQKRNFAYTNAHYSVDVSNSLMHYPPMCGFLTSCCCISLCFKDQMGKKTTRRWQLENLLHANGLDGITGTYYAETDAAVAQARTDPIEAKLSGAATVLDIDGMSGLPPHLSRTETDVLYEVLRKSSRGNNATLHWDAPISCASQYKTSLEDRQQADEDERRFVTVTLRSTPSFQHRPAQDNVKVLIEEDENSKMIYFGK